MTHTGWDYLTAKYDGRIGTLLWQERYPSGGISMAEAIASDSEANVFVTGRTWNGTNYASFTLKSAAADGRTLWEKHYNSPTNTDNQAYALSCDVEDNVLIAGYFYNPTNS